MGPDSRITATPLFTIGPELNAKIVSTEIEAAALVVLLSIIRLASLSLVVIIDDVIYCFIMLLVSYPIFFIL